MAGDVGGSASLIKPVKLYRYAGTYDKLYNEVMCLFLFSFVLIDYEPDWTKHPFIGALVHTSIHAYV